MTGDGMKSKANHKLKRVELGEHIVADPQVCHGNPTFKGTRIMVFQVLEQVAHGTPWERIVWSWRGKVPLEPITEAIQSASHYRGRGLVPSNFPSQSNANACILISCLPSDNWIGRQQSRPFLGLIRMQ